MKTRAAILAVAILLMLCLTLGLCACGGAPETGGQPDSQSDDSGLTLYDFDGWWCRPDGYEAEGISMVDLFLIDAAADTWEAFDTLGNGAGALPAYVEGGILYLQLGEPMGDACFWIGGYDFLMDEEGNVVFVRGGAPNEPALSSLDGRWFLNGDTSAEYYEFSGSSYQKFLSPQHTGTPIESGGFDFSSITLIISSEVTIENVLEVDLDGSMMAADLYPTDDGCALIDDFDKKYYIHESAIGTPEGETAMQYGSLICNEWLWRDDAGTHYLQFKHPGQFRMVDYPPGGGQGETLAYGSFSIEEGELWLDFSDGDSDVIYLYGIPDSLTLEYAGETFERW